MLSKWIPIPIDERLLSVFDEDLKLRGIFMNPPPPDSTEEEMVKYSVEQEEKMVQFYLSFERNFVDAWKRMHLERLVMEERAHANQLISLYPQFKDSLSWKFKKEYHTSKIHFFIYIL